MSTILEEERQMVWGEREVVNDLRGNLRVKEHIPVRWSVKDTALNGKGRILNISATGILLETPNVLATEKSIFNIETIKANGIVIPKEGRLVWSKEAGFAGNRKLCGLEFVEPSEEVVSKLREKVQKGIVKGASSRRWKSLTGTLLSAIMLILTAVAVRQYTENYDNTMQAYQLLAGSYEQQANLAQTYARELNTTKDLLAQAQAELEAAKTEISQLNQSNSDYKSTISQLEEKNAQIASEMAALQARLGFLEGNVKDLDEAKSLISEYKNKFRLVKTKIKAFNREAFEAKVSAQKEKDRIAMLLGNNGYLVKDGKVHAPDPDVLAEKNRIQIDVEIVK